MDAPTATSPSPPRQRRLDFRRPRPLAAALENNADVASSAIDGPTTPTTPEADQNQSETNATQAIAPVNAGILSRLKRSLLSTRDGATPKTPTEPASPPSTRQPDTPPAEAEQTRPRESQVTESIMEKADSNMLDKAGSGSLPSPEPEGGTHSDHQPSTPAATPATLHTLLKWAASIKGGDQMNAEQLKAALLQFQTDWAGVPVPSPIRQAIQQQRHAPREEYGLYHEKRPIISHHSINKVEQRLLRAAPVEVKMQAAGSQVLMLEHNLPDTQPPMQTHSLERTVSTEGMGTSRLSGTNPEIGPSRHSGTNPEIGPAEETDALLSASQSPQPISPTQRFRVQSQVQTLSGPIPEVGTGEETNALLSTSQFTQPMSPTQRFRASFVPADIQQPLNQWFDDDGLLNVLADPTKKHKERPDRLPENDDHLQVLAHRPISQAAAGDVAEAVYRLDLELGQLEFLCHPQMSKEHMLAAKLMSMFCEFKRKESIGLGTFYKQSLAALEDSLLAAREGLFEKSEAGAPQEDLDTLTIHVAQLEHEVAEMRQLVQEEDELMYRMIENMKSIYQDVQMVRQSHGYSQTAVDLTLQPSLEPDDMVVTQGGLSRMQLDALLLVEEMHNIYGLPAAPELFSPRESGFQLRRVESMCTAWLAARADLLQRIKMMQERDSTDVNDPDLLQLQQQLENLGPAPRRAAVSPEQHGYMRLRAEEAARDGEVNVDRYPKLNPILSETPQECIPPNSTIRSLVSKSSYFCKVLINNKEVGASQPVPLNDNFCAEFKETFSVNLVRWPDSIQLKLFEAGSVRDKLLATIPLAVPGIAGSPPVDPMPRSYEWSCPTPLKPKSTDALGLTASLNQPAGTSMAAIYPEGKLLVRCGWLHDSPTARLADTVSGLYSTIASNPMAASSPMDHDAEATHELMPPQPMLGLDRLLQQAVGAGKANHAQIHKWLAQEMIDPNDPKNAHLLELLKSREASSDGQSKIFRLELPRTLAFQVQRAGEGRAKFLKRRWESGPYMSPSASGGSSLMSGYARHMRIPAALGPWDETELEPLYLKVLALLDGSVAEAGAGMGAPDNQNRSLWWAQGAIADALMAREARMKEFITHVRSMQARASMGSRGCQFKVEDVVRDTPLPEIKLSVKAMAEFLKPASKLRPKRGEVKFRQAGLARKMELLVTIQKASNLPSRAQGGGRTNTFGGAGTAGKADVHQTVQRYRRGRTEDTQPDVVDPQGTGSTYTFSTELCSFIEVKLQGCSDRTCSVDGMHPLWNEQIVLPFTMKGEYSPSALLESDEMLVVNVFDEILVETQKIKPRHRRQTETPGQLQYPSREQHFLGCLRIPLSTVYNVGILEGTFTLEVPPVILGYSQPNSRPPSISIYITLQPPSQPPSHVPEQMVSGEQEDINRHAARWSACLHEMTSCKHRRIQPMAYDSNGVASLVCRFLSPTTLPPDIHDAYKSSLPRSEATLDKTEPPQEEDTQEGDSKQAIPQHDSTAQQAVLLSGDELSRLMLDLARYVSLIPYLSSSLSHKRRKQVWLSNAEMLQMASGDHEEHANLLAGYFLELGQQAYVVLGTSLAGAMSAFVLTTGKPFEAVESEPASDRDRTDQNKKRQPPTRHQHSTSTDKLMLWNPLTGHSTPVSDPACEMREVTMVYDQTNIWANTQLTGQPWAMNWDLTKAFKPFFGPALPKRVLASLQTPPEYNELAPRCYEELETRVEETVRNCIVETRLPLVTKLKSTLCKRLKDLLRSVPQDVEKINLSSFKASESLLKCAGNWTDAVQNQADMLAARQQLLNELQGKHNDDILRKEMHSASSVIGHIIALPFSDQYAEAVEEAVLNTGIHRTIDENARFAHAALVERTGSAFVCCIWIYVAAVSIPE